ncbi:class I SAM-dependent methyltransferase [Paenibacillus wenxiniae]|uniref:Class I SAM-dependent methyltransferase n=1 Tax=Paenibacillus wenxiniae TaxID=1636843 RepID=A0ABW4RGL8_9BACL
MQSSDQNKSAWNGSTYQSWLNRFGTPQEAAAKITADPRKRVSGALHHMGDDIKGKRIINLMGSNGNKAVALALLGAELTVADFSPENEQYALELAAAADVPLQYIVSDVLELPQTLNGHYDIAFMEFGILHYFTDLHPLWAVVARLLQPGGRLVLQDFHPISTKLISSRGTTAKIRKHKVDGDYFDTSLVEKEVSYSKYAESGQVQEEKQKVYLRNWTLGEIVTSIANTGLIIKTLEELPNQSSEVFDKGIPKTFTIVAEKAR